MAWSRGRTIGRGSSATVSLAVHHQSGEVFAVKSAELSRSEVLQREQSILSELNSPHVTGYLGCDITNENGRLVYNLFMEYVSGGTLTEAIRHQGGGRLDESAIRSHTLAILRGLDYLHSRGLVHCDIKGRNVLIGQNGTKIADLGCARWVGEQPPAMPIAGTPVFMAPEVARGDEQGFAADVWAVGCTVIEMATGRPPWPDVADPVSALHRIAFSSDLPEIPSFLSSEAKDFLGKCLRRDPNERWAVHELLKHPFLRGGKRIQSSISPISILDQRFWDSLEELETETEAITPVHMTNQFQLGRSSNSPAERIRNMMESTASSSSSPTPEKLPDWTWDGEWVTVRRSNRTEEHVVSICHDQTMTPTEEHAETIGSASADLISDEDEPSIQYSVNSINFSSSSWSSSSHGRVSPSCKYVRDVGLICNYNYLGVQGERKVLISPFSVLL